MYNNHSEYVKRSVVLGKTVSYIKNGATVCARVQGINEDFSLVLENENGKTDEIASGEISIRAQDAYM